VPLLDVLPSLVLSSGTSELEEVLPLYSSLAAAGKADGVFSAADMRVWNQKGKCERTLADLLQDGGVCGADLNAAVCDSASPGMCMVLWFLLFHLLSPLSALECSSLLFRLLI